MTIGVNQMYEKCREGVGFAAKHNPEHEYDDLPEDWADASPTIRAFVQAATTFANQHCGEMTRINRGHAYDAVSRELSALDHKIQRWK